jgi:hypothetical protein
VSHFDTTHPAQLGMLLVNCGFSKRYIVNQYGKKEKKNFIGSNRVAIYLPLVKD